MIVTFFRTLILYVLVIISMRLMGKRQLGQLQPFELVVAIMFSELAAVPMQDTRIPLAHGIIPIITLLIAQMALSLITLKSIKARTIIDGKPRILIENGKIREEAFRNEMFTFNDLMEQLRIKNVPNIADVEFAILETNGQLSIIPKSQSRPVTPKDLNIQTGYEGMPLDMIVDGHIVYEHLKKANLDENWLMAELEKYNVRDVKNVLFACLDPQGNLYLQKKTPGRQKNNQKGNLQSGQ